jgi:membrane associated rhomboid family serine protease
MAVCYRHPNRETGVSCSNCGNPICPDCMTATPVGMRCPDCSKQRTKVTTLRSMHADPRVTYVLIAVCVLVYVGTSGGALFSGPTRESLLDLGLAGVFIAEGELYRLITSGFMHGGPIHILLNMYILYWLGTQLEPVLGHVRFAALYFAALLSGSFGALLLSPDSLTVGASGAVFGLMGAAFFMQRSRGIDPWRSGIVPLILLNLAISFFPGLNISVGGHLGGLIGGGIAAYAMDQLAMRRRGQVLPVLAATAVGALAVAGSVAVA